jgi:excisionase family DNA binding protein
MRVAFAVCCGLMGISIGRKEDPVAGQSVVANVAAEGRSDRVSQGKRRDMNSAPSLSVRALYTVPEAMAMLNLSRTVIYEQIRSGRLLTVTQGRRRLVPASSMTAYVDLLMAEAMRSTNARTP